MKRRFLMNYLRKSAFHLRLNLGIILLLFVAPIYARADSPEAARIARLEAEVAQNPDDLDLRYNLGQAYNSLAMLDEEDENEAAMEKALDTFEYIYERDPRRIDARAMVGSTTVLKARFAFVITKIHWAKKGFAILDETVEAEPDNAHLRLIRAANSSKVPGFLGRGDEAREDFAWLLAEMARSPEKYEDAFRRSVYFYAGEYALENDDESAVDLLRKAQATAGAKSLDHRIAKALTQAEKEFPESFSPNTE